ncbi:MAG TPA: hypothetical protein VHB70_18920, partial [Parafilimonas sp.]|nr:hypothetical protein [Parafilimonas sp.]
MKIAACVILYNPGESVIDNIQSYIEHVDKLYLIDNTESASLDFQKNYNSLSKTIIVQDSLNEGIAKRLNQACQLAVKDGLDYLLTMDQDSFFHESIVKKYFECIQQYLLKEKVAMFGVNYEQEIFNADCNCSIVKILITSGSVINLSNYKNIGGFDENLFIDFVDTDYCFKSILKGYELVQFSNIYMHHEIGTTTQHRSLKNMKLSTRSIHSSIRLYYMTRNFLYLQNKYKEHFKQEFSVHKKDLLN